VPLPHHTPILDKCPHARPPHRETENGGVPTRLEEEDDEEEEEEEEYLFKLTQ
jgi:hypothetical protein